MVATTGAGTAGTTRRSEVERLLDEYKVQWRFEEDLPLSRIDEKRSLGNQARIDQPLIPDLMEQYVEARKHGDVFPAIVVHEESASKPVVNVDGNHRYASAKAVGMDTHPAYVIKAKPETLRVLMTLLNVIHGRGLSDKERLYHAFFLIDQGTGIDKAAEVLRLPVTRLRNAWALEGANRRARELGLKNKAWSDLPQSIRIRLSQLSTDAAFRDLTTLVVKSDMTGVDVSKIVTDVNKLRSEKAQLDRIKEEATFRTGDIQASAGGVIPRKQTPKNALRMHLGAINKIPLNDIPAMVTSEEGEVLAQVCIDASEALVKLADQLTR